MLEFEWILIFLLLGTFVGFMAGLLGVGGGGIMVPALTSIFLFQGVPLDKVVHLALGTSMASIVVTSFSSLRAHHANNVVIWKIVRGMSLGIVIGTFGATYVASNMNSFYLAIFFSVFMMYVSVNMLFSKKSPLKNNHLVQSNLLTAGAGIGGISALVSIGGGSLTVTYLLWQSLDVKKAIGTSAAIGLPISIAGTLGYLINGWNSVSDINYSYGYVYLPAVALISFASFFTAKFGANMAHHLPVAILKRIFALLLAFLSVKMLLAII